MSRQLLAGILVAVLFGLAPAASIIGFCTQMPCCRHAPADSMSLASHGSDCCSTVACYPSPSAKLAASIALDQPHAVTARFVAVASVPESHAQRLPVDASPPHMTRDRLALLSLLLI